MPSVRERENGTYSVLFRQGKKQSSRTFESRKPAERLVELMTVLGVERGLAAFAEEQPGRERGVTLDEVFVAWLPSKMREITPRAINDYMRDYNKWIAPRFGHREAAGISELDVQHWVDNDLATLAPKTVADRHALLHQMFAWAAEKKRAMVPNNPCKETHLPKRVKKAPKGLTLPEYLALRDAAYRINEEAADLIVFFANTGLRIGEATALQVRSVDDTGPKMYISVERVNRKGEGVVEGAKSQAGLRRMRMLPEAAAVLRRRMIGKGPSDLVFTNSHSPLGLWEPSTFRNRWWAKAVKEAGLEDRHPTPHFLRHTHVLLCHAAGMTLPEIQRRIGHEDIKTTINVYGRLIDDMSDEVEERLNAMLTGPAPVLGQVIRSVEHP